MGVKADWGATWTGATRTVHAPAIGRLDHRGKVNGRGALAAMDGAWVDWGKGVDGDGLPFVHKLRAETTRRPGNFGRACGLELGALGCKLRVEYIVNAIMILQARHGPRAGG